MDHILQRMASDTSVDAPADALKYARDLFGTRMAQPKATVLERVFAVLSLDLAPNRAAFGERSSSAAHIRQMLFESGDNAIDIRVTAGEGRGFNIKGQILGEGFETGEAEIEGEGSSITAAIDDLSGFSFTGLSAGEYTLTVRGLRTEIFIDKLTLS